MKTAKLGILAAMVLGIMGAAFWFTSGGMARASCPDPLATFAQTHPALEMTSCSLTPGGQTLLRAEYKVVIGDFQTVEAFLVERYGMKPLVWECCGLSGRGGGFTLTPKQARTLPLNHPQHPEWASGIVSMSVAVEDEEQQITDIETHGVARVFVEIAEV